MRANKKRRRYSSIHRSLTMESSTSGTINGPRYSYVAELANIKTSKAVSEEEARTCKNSYTYLLKVASILLITALYIVKAVVNIFVIGHVKNIVSSTFLNIRS